MKSSLGKLIFLVLAVCFISANDRGGEYNNEPYRPQYHFTPETYCMGNPCGLVYSDGEYHLFYKYNPSGLEEDYTHWGHAVSTDLIHWKYLSVAIKPDKEVKDEDDTSIGSGCGLVDENNLLGLQKGEKKTLLLFYTNHNSIQKLAYSTDKGRTWAQYDKNLVIPIGDSEQAQDPKVFWHKKSKKYVMVLSRKPDGRETQRGISIYTSDNLTDWEYKSHMPGFYASPDLVEMSVNGREDEKKWVLFDVDGSYIIGSFNGEEFIPEQGKQKSDYGKNYYATQTWSNLPEKDGRTIQIAWMKGGEYPGMPFNGQMSFPCELSLEKSNDDITLIRKPIKEIERLYYRDNTWAQKNVIPGLNKNLLSKVKKDCLHFIGTFDMKTSDNFGLLFRSDKYGQGIEVSYNIKNKLFSCFGEQIPVEPIEGKLQLEILLDRSSVEVFINGGKTVVSACFTPQEKNKNLILYSNGGELLVDKLDIYYLNSIWEIK